MTNANTPLLSVVVPFYNVEAYIGACLESIRTQLLDDIEVVMVCDGSQDGSLAIAEQYADRDARFRVVVQENQGLGPARNTGTANSSGKYITFVDSDDLVAPRAYTLMVGSLEESGSSLAAGNSYRFSSTKGAYQSWTHREPFRNTLIGTNINDHPVLMRDRMIWNKVYRRSFWDAGAYEFPAIRYEDYMVTLRAYLEAPAVDIFSEHVYFWRDRESGDSITQLASRWDNAIDRYLSAVMVLDVLKDHGASDEVRERVHAYFIHIDLVALAESMVSVPPEHRTEAERMAVDLAKRLDPGAEFETTRLAHLVHTSLLAGDLSMVRNLARWRISGDTKTFGKALLKHPRPHVVPTALGAVLSRRAPQNPLKARKLKTQLTSAHWEGQVLRLTGSTTLRPQFAHRATLRAELVTEEASTSVRATTTPTPTGVEVLIEIDVSNLEGLGERWDLAELWVELRLQGLAWRGKVNFEPELLPAVRQMPDGRWVQPRGVGLFLGLERLLNPIIIDRVEFDGSTFRVHPAFGDFTRPITVRRPAPSPSLDFELSAGAAEIDAASLIVDDPADNLITRIAERPIVQEVANDMPPLWRFDVTNAEKKNLPAWPQTRDAHTYLAGDSAQTVIGDRRIIITRGWYGMLVVRQEPASAREASPRQNH